MKSSALLLLVCFFSISVFANNPEIEKKGESIVQELEYKIILENLLDSNTKTLNPFINEKCKVIIIDDKFNKIREEALEKLEDICSQSTLTPTIYRSEFIIKIHNISYYMLRNDVIN